MPNVDMEKIYNEYFKVVYKYLICLTHSQEKAEDLVQETFCKAIIHIEEFREECKISVWLCQIAKNLWLNELKKNKKISETNIDLLEIAEQYDIEDDFSNKEDIKMLYEKISKLELPIRKIMYFKLIGNLTFKEIGEIMEKNEVWARVNFYRAKQKLKEVGESEK